MEIEIKLEILFYYENYQIAKENYIFNKIVFKNSVINFCLDKKIYSNKVITNGWHSKILEFKYYVMK
jgi:hypothetical protein